MKWFRKQRAVCLTLILVAGLCCGCGKSNQANSRGANAPAPGAGTARQNSTPQTPFEKDLQYVRNGQFNYIFVFARKDQRAFEKDDIAYLKANSPQETNQWVRTDEGRRIIAGTNFEFTPENLEALRQRFNVEDYSGR
ncbi:MAG TPA: hypothetical protein VGB17_07660 [Pyrinomonadaceae bacterium]|jgi:hypothetical protein